MQESPAAEFNIIRMSSEKEGALAEEIHWEFICRLRRWLIYFCKIWQICGFIYLVARIPPTTFVITSFPSRACHLVATSSIDRINASYSSFPLNMEVHSLRSSESDART